MFQTFMLYGLPDGPTSVGACLHPMPLGTPNQSHSMPKPNTVSDADLSLRPGAKPKENKQSESKAKKNQKKRGGKKGVGNVYH